MSYLIKYRDAIYVIVVSGQMFFLYNVQSQNKQENVILNSRIENMRTSADQMAFYITESTGETVAFSEKHVAIGNKTLPRPVDWSKLKHNNSKDKPSRVLHPPDTMK